MLITTIVMLVAVIVVLVSFCGTSTLYIKKGCFKDFYHDALGWCQPDGLVWGDGCSMHSKCKHCGREIVQDSQGNWF